MNYKQISVVPALVAALLLSACGSGGSSTPAPQQPPVSAPQEPTTPEEPAAPEEPEASAPQSPTVTLTPKSIKTFAFSWEPVDGATEYRLMENPDDNSGFTEVASAAADETTLDLKVFLPERINASYILQACNDNGCTDSTTAFVSGTLALATGYFKASNTDAGDQFGQSVAMSADGSTLAVGAIEETSANGDQSDNSAERTVAVYVFVRDAGEWSQQAYLKASNTNANAFFGGSIALSSDGSTLAVGAQWEASASTGIDGDQSDNTATGAGAVYVFVRDAGEWGQQAYVKASNTDQYDYFGSSVALSSDGNTLAVGAHGEESSATGINGDQSDNSAVFAGAVYVFVRDADTWRQQAYVKARNAGIGDGFGLSVALSANGDTLAVGAPWEDSSDVDQRDNYAPLAGGAHLFVRDAGVWSQQAYIKASNIDEGDYFGTSVALSADGNTLAVGANREGSSATDINGDQSDNSAEKAGAVYVFAREASAWSQQAYIEASNTDADDFFGTSVALSADGNALAVGAPSEDSAATGIEGDENDNSAAGAGAVYVFARDASVWSQQAYVKASNTVTEDSFGTRVALSADGNILAATAPGEDSAATGIDGDQSDNSAAESGAVYLY